jgi:G3E family GTPase
MNKITPIALGITLAVSSFAQAEEGFRQHSAHVHGVVEFNIAQDANELLMEITAPGADVVGFEHAPQTDEQKHQLEAAVAQLKDANSIFTLAASAGCKVEHKSVTHTLGEDSHKGHDHHDDHEHHDEHKGHDHHDDHEGHSSSHGEFTVEYHFECSDIAKLDEINTNWFSHFPNTESIKVNVLTDTKQAAMQLSKGESKISL